MSMKRTIQRAFVGGLALVSLLLCAPPARAVNVDVRHPRILFYADSLDAVRTRAFSVNQPYFAKWYEYYDTRRNHPNFAEYWAEDMAALYLVTRETKFADVAIRQAMKRVKSGVESQYAMARMNEVPLTYDWCYDRLTAAQKDSIVAYCLVQMNRSGPDEPYRAQDLRWQYALAIWGEAGAQNANVDAKLQSCITLAETRIFPCLDAIASGGTTGYYPGVYYSNYMTFVDCLRFATHYSGPILQSSYWNNSPTYWMHRIRPDLKWMRATGRYNMSDAGQWEFCAYFASRDGNHFAQTLANLFAARTTSDDGSGGMPTILWYNPGGASEPLSNMSRTFADEGYGYYFHRSDWNLGSSSTDIQVAFYNGPDVEPDHERTQNSFTVSRGADDLLISAGKFYDSEDQHYTNYARRAVSRNTVLIYDPSESFGAGVPNDGGQCDASLPRGRAKWPECGGGNDWGIGYRGVGALIPAGPKLVFGVRGSASAAYSTIKADTVCRELRMPAENWILLRDHVVLHQPRLKVTLVFHSIEKPTVDGTLGQVEGNTNGGIWLSKDTKVITIQRGGSQARIYPVYAQGGFEEVRIVGGASPSSGLPWRQNVNSRAALTYVSNASEQAYECWVDGANRSPTQSGLTQTQINARNAEPEACGDWRVEIMVRPTGSLVDAVTAIEIGPRDLPAHVPGWSESGGRVTVTVTGTGDDFGIDLPKTACTE